MPTPDLSFGLPQRLRVMRIILVALIGGVGTFFLIAVSMRLSGAVNNAPPNPVVTYVGFAYAVALLIAHQIVPSRVVAATRRVLVNVPADALDRAEQAGLSPDAASLLAAYQTRLIVGAALIEGIALFFLIAFMLEGLWVSLVFAGLCLVMLAAKFPTEDGVSRWLEGQEELLQYERGLR